MYTEYTRPQLTFLALHSWQRRKTKIRYSTMFSFTPEDGYYNLELVQHDRYLTVHTTVECIRVEKDCLSGTMFGSDNKRIYLNSFLCLQTHCADTSLLLFFMFLTGMHTALSTLLFRAWNLKQVVDLKPGIFHYGSNIS